MTSNAGRRLRVLERFRDSARLPGSTLCDVAAEVIGVSGAGIMLMSLDVAAGSACSTDAVATTIEDLQFTLGEGPCVDAHRVGRPVLEPDLESPLTARWPAFSPAALDAGARAVFGFPLLVGAVRLGALDLYQRGRGPLGDDQHADALVAADVVARALLAMQADSPPGTLAAGIEADGDLHYVVHQASGMVAAQLEVSVAQALARLRAHAYAHDRPLADVAGDVVARRLAFHPGDDDASH